MQTPGSIFQPRSRMVTAPATRLPLPEQAKGTGNLLGGFERIGANILNIRNILSKDSRDKQNFEGKRDKLLKKEEESLTTLRSATSNLRKIIGVAAGASALNQFQQGNIGAGLQDTGLAVTAFLPEIINITSQVVVGGLATKGLLGGGGTGGRGMPMPKGRAGLLALPLLALAPLLMGAGRNNQSNAPTSEFRREQAVRGIRRTVISADDTDRFGRQLDRFERLIDSFGGRRRTPQNINQTIGDIDLELPEEEPPNPMRDRPVGEQVIGFTELIQQFTNPFQQIGDIFKNKDEQSEDFGRRTSLLRNIFGGIMNIFTPKANSAEVDENAEISEEMAKFIEETDKEFFDDEFIGEFSSTSSGTNKVQYFDKDGKEIDPLSLEAENLKKEAKDLFFNSSGASSDVSKDVNNLVKEAVNQESSEGSGSTTVLGDKKEKMTKLMKNFLGLIQTEFIPLTKQQKQEEIAASFLNNALGNFKNIDKKALDDAPPEIRNIFLPFFEDGGILNPDDGAIADVGASTDSVFVDPEFKGSIDKFINNLLLNISK